MTCEALEVGLNLERCLHIQSINISHIIYRISRITYHISHITYTLRVTYYIFITHYPLHLHFIFIYYYISRKREGRVDMECLGRITPVICILPIPPHSSLSTSIYIDIRKTRDRVYTTVYTYMHIYIYVCTYQGDTYVYANVYEYIHMYTYIHSTRRHVHLYVGICTCEYIYI